MADLTSELKKFGQAAHSLKLYRRADLRDDVTDKSLISKLYVDPLQNDAVLDTLLRESTTFLIGRKGTGKSTIFQRAQHELRSRTNTVSAYVDIKTVFEAADVDQSIPANLAQVSSALGEDGLKRVLLYRAFIRAVFQDVKKELKQQVGSGLFRKALDRLGLKKSDISSSIDELLEGSFEAQITDVTAVKAISRKLAAESQNTNTSTRRSSAKGNVGAKDGSLSADIEATAQSVENTKGTEALDFSDIVIRTFAVGRVIEDLGRLLESIGVKKLYIFIDDFSELPEEAMHVFVDAVLAPLNNWSNELIKFKVAAYPGRIYLGKIDPTKIDEVYLDLFRLYGERDVSTMEEKGADFVKRLINSRFEHYVGKNFAEFCDHDVDAVYRELFYASMANPRILGHLLTYIRDSTVAYGRPVQRRAVIDASTKYYEEKIEPYFGIHKFALESFSERASTFSLKELLEALVQRAVDLRDYKGSKVTAGIKGRTPTSHFHVATTLDAAVRTLELNFFLTLYYEMKDRDGKKVSVYALNHGLCGKYSVSFGRPSGNREYRLYFVERVFDYTSIVRSFLESNQEIRCHNCGAVHGLDKLDGLVMFDMLCPACKQGKCEVLNLSKKYESVLRSVDPSLLLPPTDLGMLDALYTEDRQMVASEIAGELDCSYQLIGKRGRNLAERGLVMRDKNEVNRRVFSLTQAARDEYFKDNADRELEVRDPGHS